MQFVAPEGHIGHLSTGCRTSKVPGKDTLSHGEYTTEGQEWQDLKAEQLGFPTLAWRGLAPGKECQAIIRLAS